MKEELFKRIAETELEDSARKVLELAETADPCFIGGVVALLVLLGFKMSAGQPILRRWGLRVAATVFVAYAALKWYQTGGTSTEAIAELATRSAIMAGGVLSFLWIVLPILSFVYHYLRLGCAAFLAYGGYALATAETINAEDLRITGLRGLGVAGLAMVVAWILQPLWDFLSRLFPRKTEAPAPTTATQPSTPPPTPQQVPEPTSAPAPQRALVEQPTESQQRQLVDEEERVPLEPDHTTTRRRRDRIRLKVEMVYVLIQPQIAPTFDRNMFEDFVKRYLGDHLPPEEVEENGRQLLALLEAQRGSTGTEWTNHTFPRPTANLAGPHQKGLHGPPQGKHQGKAGPLEPPARVLPSEMEMTPVPYRTEPSQPTSSRLGEAPQASSPNNHPEPSTLEDLTRWFLGEQQRLANLDLDPDSKQHRLEALNEQYANRVERLLQPSALPGSGGRQPFS